MLTELSQVENTQQIITFLLSVLLGIGISLLYCLFRWGRIVFPVKKIGLFFQDVLFFALSAIAVFFFLMIRCEGVFRIYVLFGVAFGAVFGHLTIGKYTSRLMVTVTLFIGRHLRRIFRPVWGFSKKTKERMVTQNRKTIKSLKNIFKRKKKPLENPHTVDV